MFGADKVKTPSVPKLAASEIKQQEQTLADSKAAAASETRGTSADSGCNPDANYTSKNTRRVKLLKRVI